MTGVSTFHFPLSGLLLYTLSTFYFRHWGLSLSTISSFWYHAYRSLHESKLVLTCSRWPELVRSMHWKVSAGLPLDMWGVTYYYAGRDDWNFCFLLSTLDIEVCHRLLFLASAVRPGAPYMRVIRYWPGRDDSNSSALCSGRRQQTCS
jgi:hypothetical protein